MAAMPAIRPRDAADYVITTDLSRGRGGEIMFSGRVVNARTGVVLSVNEYIETTGGVDGEVQRETRQTLLRRAVSRIASPFGIIYSNELRARAASDRLSIPMPAIFWLTRRGNHRRRSERRARFPVWKTRSRISRTIIARCRCWPIRK